MAHTPPLCESKSPRTALLDPRGLGVLERNAHSWCLVFRESLISGRSSCTCKWTWQHTKCLSFHCLLEAITRIPGDLQTPGGHSALACPHSGKGTQTQEGQRQGPPRLPRDALPACASPCRRGTREHSQELGPGGEPRRRVGVKDTQARGGEKKKV